MKDLLGMSFFCQKRIAKFSYILFFMLSSTAPLFWDNGYYSSIFLGYGDYVSPFNSWEKLQQLFYVNDLMSFGGADQSFNQSFILYYTFHFILEFIGFSSAVVTTLMLCASLFAAQYGFYIYIKDKFGSKKNWPILVLLLSGSVLYGCSPYYISNIFPGHLSAIFLFALFPFLIRYFEVYLDGPSYLLPFSICIRFIICMLLSAAAFANIGNFIALVMVLFGYTAIKSVVCLKRSSEYLFKCLFFIFLMLLMNAWWMLAFAVDIGEAVVRNQSANLIGSGLLYAVKYSTMFNIFSGLPEAVFHIKGFLTHEFYLGWVYSSLVMSVFAIGIIGIILSNPKVRVSWQIPMLGLLLLSVFISKGPNPPFGQIFMFAWDHIPAFQIFRRPASKIYWLYWFCFAALGTAGSITIYLKTELSRALRVTTILMLVSAASFSYIALAKTTLLKGITPPSEYFIASEFLKSDGVSRVFMMPNADGAPYTMSDRLSQYYGVDFFEQMINSVVLIPEMASDGNLTYFQGRINELGKELFVGSSLCKSLKELGITHLVFSSDVKLSDAVMQIYRASLRNAYLSKDLDFVHKFGALTIFRVREVCIGSVATVDLHVASSEIKTSTNLIQESPVSFSLLAPAGVQSLDVVLRSDFSRNWVLDVHNIESSNFKIISMRVNRVLNYAFSSKLIKQESDSDVKIKHTLYSQYGNEWNVNLPDNNINYQVNIRYIKQDIFLLGVIVSIFSSALIMLISWFGINGFKFKV